MIYDKLNEAGITRDRLKTALDSKENWGGMVHAFEFLTVLGVVLDEWPTPENVECQRCSAATDPIFHHESGGLCGHCLADDGMPLMRVGEP